MPSDTVIYTVLLGVPVIAVLLAFVPFLKGSGGGGKGPRRVGKYDPKTGIGRGAPGFQTNVARVPVPAAIVARIRAGEEVSAEEITAAQEEHARRVAKGLPTNDIGVSKAGKNGVSEEWLPESAKGGSPAGRKRGGRK